MSRSFDLISLQQAPESREGAAELTAVAVRRLTLGRIRLNQPVRSNRTASHVECIERIATTSSSQAARIARTADGSVHAYCFLTPSLTSCSHNPGTTTSCPSARQCVSVR